MWRVLILTFILIVLPTAVPAQGQPTQPVWEQCRGAPGATAPEVRDCRPVEGVVDPQGRELWLRAVVVRPTDAGPAAVYMAGVASSEIWFNGQRLGANGRPGASADSEVAGRYQTAFPISDRMWRPSGNVVVVHLSSFHGSVRLAQPMPGMLVAAYPWPSRFELLAITLITAGALFAAAFGFGVIFSLRRTASSLTLAVLAGVSGLQAILESLRTLIAYAYPLHGLRLVGIWGLSAAFSILLVTYVASRFWPKARRLSVALAATAVATSYLAPGFDRKTVLALMIGVGLSAAAAAVGVVRRLPAARLTLLYLAAFLTIAALYPTWLADLTFFLFAAGLILPLLMTEVVRLGRDDQAREAALARAAARPDCLTVVSSRRVERVPIVDVVAIVGADDYVELRLAGGRRLLHSARLDRLEADLPATFLRTHRSVIANMDHVRGFERDGGAGRLLMTEGPVLPISRNRLSRVREALDLR